MDIAISNYKYFSDYPQDVSCPVPKPPREHALAASRSTVHSPMFKPPPEIISRIIELGFEDGEPDFPRLVSHVSGWLRDVALGNPTFWATITAVATKTSREEILMRLERSKGVPLDITISGLYTRHDAEDVLDLLYPHVGRWRTLQADLRTTYAMEAFIQALVDPAPLLQSVSLFGVSNAYGPVHIFGGNVPSLKSLSIRNISLPWDSPLFHDLTSLQVHSSTCTPSYMTQWRNLQKLVIRVEPMQQLVLDLPTMSTVILPELESLELNGVTEYDVTRLLSIVELPHLSRLLFTHVKSSRNSEFHAINALPALRHLRLHTAEMSHENLLNLLARSRNLECISFEDSSPMPSFITKLTPTQYPMTWLCPKLSSFHVLAFEKDNAPRFYSDNDIANALRDMIYKRRVIRNVSARMRLFNGYRNAKTRHAAPWGEDWPFISDESVVA
ncbi:hypothetical protein FRB95_000128 [Tulasnella sp. JGI-2019a]|nr:hypothetical protein FRB95_000128 [Tulasnella sp. JGI-2019a]